MDRETRIAAQGVRTVFATIRNPSGPGDVSQGFYLVEGNMLTMTNLEGIPVRDVDGDTRPSNRRT
jgi:hypothetical protein